jgi:pimeloyl-ACP methyl ester carboxylesterase
MLAVHTDAAQSRVTANEWDIKYDTTRKGRPAALWFHGNTQTALTDYASYLEQLRTLAQSHTVYAADFGGSGFGNDAQIAKVIALMDHYDIDDAVFVGASMGAASALNVARVHPTRVSAVACVIPALDLDVANEHAAADEIDAAYPPGYDPENPLHAAHSPVEFASSLPATLPIHLFTSSNDPTCLPATADAFVAARPQTMRTVYGAYGHGGIAAAVPLVEAWLTHVRS